MATSADARRVLVISQPLEAGVPRQVADLVKGLGDRGWRVDVACPPGSELWRWLTEMSLAPGGLYSIGASRTPRPSDMGAVWRLVELARQADVVHAHSSKAGFLGRLACALGQRRQRCVFTPHGWSFWAARARADRQAYLAFERVAAHWCARILTVSDNERREGLRVGVGQAHQYRVVPNGIDVERFARTPTTVDGRLVSCGRLASPKRHDLVLRALASLRISHPRAHLQLIGDGPDRAWLERVARELELEDVVSFLGQRSDTPELLASAQAFVLSSDYEGFPLTVIEAMAAGLPVVASAVGGIPEAVADGETGLLVAPGSVEALAGALRSLGDRPERARAMGAAGRALARVRFTRERMATDTVAVYEELLDGRDDR